MSTAHYHSQGGDSLQKIKRFCEEINAFMYYSDETSHIYCRLQQPTTFNNAKILLRKLADKDLIDNLKNVLGELGEFEITVPIKVDVKEKRVGIMSIDYDPMFNQITVTYLAIKGYDIPRDRIELVYPDPLEDFLRVGPFEVQGRARGALRGSKLRGYAYVVGKVHLDELDNDDASKIIDYMLEIANDLLTNPRNFAKIK